MNTVIINYSNILHNFELFKKTVCKNNEEIFPVLKANGYGLDSINIAKTLLNSEYFTENSFFVFSIDEAIELKQHFSNKIKDIYVLDGFFEGNEKLYSKYNLTPIFNNFDELYHFTNYCKKHNINKKLCIQFNTGMNRNGFDINKIETIKQIITKFALKLKLIITHFAYANNKNHFVTLQQLKNCETLKQKFNSIKTSFYATEASLNFEQNYKTNIIRVGAGLHGFGLQTPFKQPFTLKSLVQLQENNLIINIGLKHGLFQEYEKNGYVYVEGKKIFIKKIEHDFCILNINDNYEKYTNKIALLTGFHNDDFIHIDDFAQMNKTIQHEIQYRITHNIQLKEKNFNLIDENNNPIKLNNNYIYENNSTNFYNHKIYSKILGIRIMENNDNYVGYDATYKTNKDELLLTIVGGYADYIHRKFTNKNIQLISQNRRITGTIAGKISMDQIVISVNKKYKKYLKTGEKIKILNINKNNNYENFLIKNNKRIDT